VVAVDEIGTMEILSDQFRQALTDVLDGDVFVIGSIADCSDPFIDAIKLRQDILIIRVEQENHDAVFKRMLELTRKTDHCGLV
jgi:nucleoside-triphosphatase THEP1